MCISLLLSCRKLEHFPQSKLRIEQQDAYIFEHYSHRSILVGLPSFLFLLPVFPVSKLGLLTGDFNKNLDRKRPKPSLFFSPHFNIVFACQNFGTVNLCGLYFLCCTSILHCLPEDSCFATDKLFVPYNEFLKL